MGERKRRRCLVPAFLSACLVLFCLLHLVLMRAAHTTWMGPFLRSASYHHQEYTTHLKEVLMVSREIERDERKEKSYANTSYEFNKFKSDAIGTFRDLPDTRHHKCKEEQYYIEESAKVSVIISFYNEAYSTLARTVASVLIQTPKSMLQEIILVNDASDGGTDGKVLLKLPKVVLYKNEKREGLIRSRVSGASKATGKFLMFLDSHCEVNRDWLQPLVYHVQKNPKSIACPMVDSIDAQNFRYNRTSDHLKAGFDWNFRFKWIEHKREVSTITQPYPSAAVTGGLFLIEKEWFDTLGGFDPGLEVWGIESLEISLKTWLCGGSLAIVPCSRVGHVFQKKHSYTFPMGNAYTYLRNSKRIADVWLGEYKIYFYKESPGVTDIEVGSLNEQEVVRDFLNCKSFQWYLDNVFPELRVDEGDSSAYGQIKQEDICLLPEAGGSGIEIRQCRNSDGSPIWSLTPNLEIKNQNLCLTAKDKTLSNTKCDGSGSQKWLRKGRSLKTWKSGLCLDNKLNNAILSECRLGAPSQSWDFSVELQNHHTLQRLF